ncbi:MAG: hypothetical protein JWO30_3401 [Fibrobacteres bacterium]|nr:hypothetical protein [Fibrobacterota bacterium]
MKVEITPDTETGIGDWTDGKAIFHKYGCVACHTETGMGIGDATLSKRDFPTDSLLQAWIRPADRFRTRLGEIRRKKPFRNNSLRDGSE